MKVEDIKVGSLWSESRKNKFLWRMRYFNIVTKSEDKVSVTLTSNSNQAKTKARKILLTKAKRKIEQSELNILNSSLNINSLTFSSVANLWLNDCSRRLKPSTLNNRRKQIKRFADEFGDQEMSQFTTFQIQVFFNSLNLKSGTVKGYFLTCKSIFDFAKRMEIISKDPTLNVKLSLSKKTLEDIKKQNRKLFTVEDLAKVLNRMRSSENPRTYFIALTIEFLFLTGLRYCELAALKEENYDRTRRIIKVETNLDYTKGVTKHTHTTTKTLSSYREVDLNDRAIEIIEEYLKANHDNTYVGYKNHGYIFCTRSGQPHNIGHLNRSFKYYGKTTGLDKQFSCHCMRHSHISLLAEMGINQKVVMQRVGHATSTITNNIYTHVTPNMSKELNQKMSRINKIS